MRILEVTPLRTLAWKIPWMEGPGRLQSVGSGRVKTRLSDFTFTFHFHTLEKEMATHSTVLAWRIPGMGEPAGLLSMGSHRVGHNWSDLAVGEVLRVMTQMWLLLLYETTPELPPSTMTGHGKKVAIHKPERGPHQELNLLAHWSWSSQPSELWEINVCCLSHLVYGSLL